MKRRITTGDLARAIEKTCNPMVTDDMTRVWAERRLVRAVRNPGNDRGWWYVLPEHLAEDLLKNIRLPAHEVQAVLNYLGLNVQQRKLF